MLREDAPGDKRLVAYVVPAERPARSTPAALRAFLQRELPEYMVPSAFVSLEALPLTSSGKVDRKALPAPDTARAEPTRPYVAPRDALEQQLADLWEEVLGVQPVGVQTTSSSWAATRCWPCGSWRACERPRAASCLWPPSSEAPTVELLAALLRQESPLPWSPLVP